MPDPTPVETKLRIAHQDFGAAKKRDTAINARGYRIGSSELGGDVIGHAVLRVVKPAAGPMVRTIRLQTPDDGEPQRCRCRNEGSGLRWSRSG